MSGSFEREFEKAAASYSRRNRQLLIRRITLSGVALAIFLTLLYLRNPWLLGLAGAAVVFALMLGKRPALSPLQRVIAHLRTASRKQLLSYALALLAFLYVAHPTLFRNIAQGMATTLLHNPTPPSQASPWPWQAQEGLHPLIADLAPEAQTSIRSVAATIAAREPDPYFQVKALHDYVVSRVSYDMNVLTTGERPPQDAQTVFRTGRAVCEGYANLFTALAKAMGLEAVTIEGDIRRDLAPIENIAPWQRAQNATYDWTLHAWNAVKVDGQWQIVDTTWDDLDEGSSPSGYSAEYLMPAPEVMIASHRPTQDAWQLLAQRKSKRAFEKQPLLRPRFFREGLQLLSPQTQPISVGRTAVIRIQQANPPSSELGAAFLAKPSDSVWTAWRSLLKATSQTTRPFIPCSRDPETDGRQRLTCTFPSRGRYQVVLYAIPNTAPPGKATPIDLGQLAFNAR